MSEATTDGPSDDEAGAAMRARHVDAAAALLDLPIAPYRDGVLRCFALAADQYAIVERVALDVRDEPGDPFVPVSPAA